jgi:hypothetical protein
LQKKSLFCTSYKKIFFFLSLTMKGGIKNNQGFRLFQFSVMQVESSVWTSTAL